MGDLDTKAGTAAQVLLDKTAKWSERLYDMSDDDIKEYFKLQGKDCNKILYIEYSYLEIGLTHEWFEENAAGIGDNLTVRRELLLQRLHGSSLSPYDREDMETIIELQRKPIGELWVDTYFKFDIYNNIDKRKAYLIGVDCSTGSGGDNNAITIVDPQSLEPVAEFECSFIGETRYEHLLISLIRDHFPRSVLCIERNSMGDGVVDHLLHSPIAQNLYYDKNKDLMAETMKGNESVISLLKREAAQKRFYGVYTNGASRDQMFAILARHINEYKEKFITANITRDITRLIRKPSGKIEAGNGFHDDSVMSYLIAMYVRYHGNNLELFNVKIGATDEELNNSGLKRPEEIDTNLVDKSLVDAAIKEEKLFARQNEYEKMMQEAIYKSQAETYKLSKKGLIENTIYDNTADFVADDYMDDTSFDSLFGSFGSLNGAAINTPNTNNYNDPFGIL